MPANRIAMRLGADTPACAEVAERMERALRAEGAVVQRRGVGEPLREYGALVIVGGDGSILSSIEDAVNWHIPILTVNTGRIGYLTELQPEDVEAGARKLLRGEYLYDVRSLLAVESGGLRGLALNEVSIKNAQGAVGVLTLEVSVSGEVIDRFPGDGLVVATATGSTAYSLSAGGPILAPHLPCMVLTPVCPHLLRARPVVVSEEEVIRVCVADDRARAQVLLDGKRALADAGAGDGVTICRSQERVYFIRFTERNFYRTLREKLSVR